MKKLFIAVVSILLLLHTSLASAQNVIAGPDGKTKVNVFTENGSVFYTVTYNDVTFIDKSPLGLNTNVGDFTNGLTMGTCTTSQISQSYSLPNIKKSQINYVATQGIIPFTKDDKQAFDIEFRVSANDVAFRYKVYPQGRGRLSCVILQEATGFLLPEGSTTFLSPQMRPMTGFARTAPSYESSYTVDDTPGKNGNGGGYVFPCLFRNNDNGWILISETGVHGNYCGSRLMGGADRLYTIGFPQEAENNGNGTVAPGIPLPGTTAWRTLTVGTTLAPIVETTVPFDVVEPLYEASTKYTYTKGSWSWIIKMDGGTVYDVQKEYIDFSAAMGFNTILVDALWDTQIGKDKIADLAAYGATKNVYLYLWYNSNGYWNDAPQGPRGIMGSTIERRKEMAWMQSIGVKGIKVDFFGGDKQVTMQLYEDILADANDYGIMVIFHGCTLPRGWERMFPNYAASEAVLASENLYFGQNNCDNEAFNACLHPFIRNTVGSMDFGGSALNKYYNANNTPGRGSVRKTSDVFALATSVLFQSGVQHFALAPNNLTDAPAWAIDFLKEVPTTWDEVRYIDGYPGKYIILARRHNNKWYIVGVNASKETLKTTVPVPVTGNETSVTLYSDDNSLNGTVSHPKLSKKGTIDLTIPCNGGAVVVL